MSVMTSEIESRKLAKETDGSRLYVIDETAEVLATLLRVAGLARNGPWPRRRAMWKPGSSLGTASGVDEVLGEWRGLARNAPVVGVEPGGSLGGKVGADDVGAVRGQVPSAEILVEKGGGGELKGGVRGTAETQHAQRARHPP